MVTLFISGSLNTRLDFNLQWRNYNEQTQEMEKKAKEPNTHWSYSLPALNLNVFFFFPLTSSLLIFSTVFQDGIIIPQVEKLRQKGLHNFSKSQIRKC